MPGKAALGWAVPGQAGHGFAMHGKATFSIGGTMIEILMWIEGTGALLMNRASEETLGTKKSRRNTVGEDPDPRVIAERGVYRGPYNQLMVPGPAFSRLLREAGGNHKAKGSRKSLKYLVPAAVFVLDELCPLYLHDRKTCLVDFEIDARPVTIPATKGRVMRYRARANEWACCVRIRINETLMSESIVRQLLIEGGQQIGIGDFRPEKGGPFGTWDLVQWDVVSEKKPTIAQKRNGVADTTQV